MRAPDPLRPEVARVRSSSRETADIVTLRLVPSPALAGARAGQFNMLWAFGVGEIPVSVSDGPGRGGELGHTVRSVGAVSGALTSLRPGESLGLRGPYGTGWPLELCRGKHVLVVGGGLGLAPLRPAIVRLLEDGACRRLTVLYGARTPEDLLFRQDLLRWGSRGEVLLTVDRAKAGWPGLVGVVPALLARVELDPAEALALVCGPEVMMRFAARELLLRGLRPERIYLSLERNMKCGVGLCGHCQLGSLFVCKDGPVLRLDRVAGLMEVREL